MVLRAPTFTATPTCLLSNANFIFFTDNRSRGQTENTGIRNNTNTFFVRLIDEYVVFQLLLRCFCVAFALLLRLVEKS